MPEFKSGDKVYLQGIVKSRDNAEVVLVEFACGYTCGNIELFVFEDQLTEVPNKEASPNA